MPNQDRILPGVVLMLMFCMIAPLIDASSKLAAQGVPVGTATLGRYVVQAALMLPVVLMLRLPLRMTAREHRLNLARALVSVLATLCFIAALRVMPMANALAIAFVEPFVILLIGYLFMGEEVGPRRLGASIVGFGGALLVIQPSFATFGAVALFPLGTAVCFALYILITRSLSRSVHPVTMQLHTALAGAAICVPMLALGPHLGLKEVSFAWPSGIFWLWVFGIGFFATVSHMAMTYALQLAPSSTLAPLHYSEMLSATFFGYMVFGDFPNALTWAGIAVIVASGLYLIHRERLTARQARQAPPQGGVSAAESMPAPASRS